jgi:hypothetical protein
MTNDELKGKKQSHSSFGFRHLVIYLLSLRQILFNPFRFAEQERGVFVGGFDRAADELHVLLELFGELLLLLIAPSGAQGVKLTGQGGHPLLKLGVEELELMGKAAELRRVDDCLRHEEASFSERVPRRRLEADKNERRTARGLILTPRR